MSKANTCKFLVMLFFFSLGSNTLCSAPVKTMYFIVTNNLPKDKACLYALPDKTLSVFYPGGPVSGIVVPYKTTSSTLKAISQGNFPVNLLGFQENTGIPCPDVYAMYPNYGACQPDSHTNGHDNSCLNVIVDTNCKVTLHHSCLNPGYELQQGISTDGSYRYQVTGKNVGKAKDGSPICQLSVNWLKDWNNPQNAATLDNHACK
ncbi:hypothetical protein [Legionella brunensis]|uniref:Secreted protein n=1 Tax=Legionella brunensis TaxID=29422 RepID=A0A0W0SLI9_9GAMM|nr:hypothetical protein [Legionella brunensis]KTC83797.1 hypothetical protein Lbru_1620 [Legionella brunensis]